VLGILLRANLPWADGRAPLIAVAYAMSVREPGLGSTPGRIGLSKASQRKDTKMQRCLKAVRRYHIQASDSRMGRLEDFIAEDDDVWEINENTNHRKAQYGSPIDRNR
jgi:hypothetical protein